MVTKDKLVLFGPTYFLLLLIVLLLGNDLAIKLASGQLEAVGAVLSVVPVTSILATAGLVGVKLAALSRLLQVLGYDQAYLANGGSGTAAQPIGLQKKYAYMFPYVPGLNISVKGEVGQYQDMAGKYSDRQQAQALGGSATTRKTYPAMGLPGDYESQNSPFRGSETLREIFREAGINVHFPSPQQQKQQFTGIPSKAAIILEFPVARTARSTAEPPGFAKLTTVASFQPEPEFTANQAPPSAALAMDKLRPEPIGRPQQQSHLQQQPHLQRLQMRDTFGMPALNIHQDRRRKRSPLAQLILEAKHS